MNKAELMGRLTRDPEVKTVSKDISVCAFGIAVDRRVKDKDGNRQADFINCVAWRGTAEFIGKHFHKGDRIAIVGSIQTRSYEDKDGAKRTATEVVADEAYFCESKRDTAESDGGFFG